MIEINIHVLSGSIYDAKESVFGQYQRFLLLVRPQKYVLD